MKSQTKCPYCGNTSGKLDSRGGCISCGGQFQKQDVEQEIPWERLNRSGSCYPIDRFIGESGREQIIFPSHIQAHSFPIRTTYYGYDLGIYTVNEIRKMVGLDEE